MLFCIAYNEMLCLLLQGLLYIGADDKSRFCTYPPAFHYMLQFCFVKLAVEVYQS